MTALCIALGAAACGGEAQKGEAPAAEAAQPSSSTSAAAEFGVKECDEYIAKYTECVSVKVPAAVRSAMLVAIDQTKAQWKAAAITPEGRAGLAEACTRAQEAAKASVQAYGCSW
jgi:hypothetical protein